LCVLDRQARELSPDQLESLNALSRQVMAQLELRLAVRRQAEALAEKDLLMQEVHHRVKNSLTMVRSFLLLQARGAKNQFVGRQLQESAARINTFSAMHEHLYRVGADSQVEISAYLKSLIDDHDAASASSLSGRTITFVADDTLWPSAEAATVGLIVIELVTNAIKYGAGTVAIPFRVRGNEAILTVEDEGKDFPSAGASQSQGLGMRIVTGLLQQQNRGRIEIDRSRGHTCVVATLQIPDGKNGAPSR
jgi:two-component sensor histidine kinase